MSDRVMSCYRIIQLIVLVMSAGTGSGLQTPFFKVTGMSNQLPDLCVVDYKSKVDISIEVKMAGCENEMNFDAFETIANIEWKFYKLHINNEYTIDTSSPYKIVSTLSSNLTWDSIALVDMNIYAVEASIVLKGFPDSFRIMGYIVVGCEELVENQEEFCSDVKQNVNSLAGNMKQIWHLRKCHNTVSSYEATSTEEFAVTSKGDWPDYNEHDLYKAGLYLQTKTTIVFQVFSIAKAFILLQEAKDDRLNNIVEIEISNRNSVIRTEQKGKAQTEYLETNILTQDEFRYFWISFAGEELRVGKGKIPYANEIMKWAHLNHDINFIALGSGNGKAIWRFDIDLCLHPAETVTCTEMTRWKYSRDSSTCEKSCEGGINCFMTENLCRTVCGVVIPSEHYKQVSKCRISLDQFETNV